VADAGPNEWQTDRLRTGCNKAIKAECFACIYWRLLFMRVVRTACIAVTQRVRGDVRGERHIDVQRYKIDF